MKKLLLLQCFFWATLSVAFGQNYIPFSIRYQGTVKGDMIVVGNTIGQLLIPKRDLPTKRILA